MTSQGLQQASWILKGEKEESDEGTKRKTATLEPKLQATNSKCKFLLLSSLQLPQTLLQKIISPVYGKCVVTVSTVVEILAQACKESKYPNGFD